MHAMIYRLIIFLVINFGALALGSLFTGKGVPSDWYQGLAKAPWTPPGWVFGAAWTTIMICLSIYMSFAWKMLSDHKWLLGLFVLQWVLNVIWNPVFFHYQQISAGFVVIGLLTLLMIFFMFRFYPQLKWWTLLLLPYVIWLLIATSLNAYILFKN